MRLPASGAYECLKALHSNVRAPVQNDLLWDESEWRVKTLGAARQQVRVRFECHETLFTVFFQMKAAAAGAAARAARAGLLWQDGAGKSTV